MKSREVYDIFSHFWSKYMDEGITENEIARHINTAQIAVLKDHFFAGKHPSRRDVHDNPSYGFESTIYSNESWRELICPFEIEPVDGIIKYEDIQASFPDDIIRDELGVIESKKPDIFHIANLGRWDGKKYQPVIWTRENDWFPAQCDPHRAPDECFPIHRIQKDFIEILPKGSNKVKGTVVRLPIHMWIDCDDETLNIDPELNDFVMLDVILRALTFASINIREAELYSYAKQEEIMQ